MLLRFKILISFLSLSLATSRPSSRDWKVEDYDDVWNQKNDSKVTKFLSTVNHSHEAIYKEFDKPTVKKSKLITTEAQLAAYEYLQLEVPVADPDTDFEIADPFESSIAEQIVTNTPTTTTIHFPPSIQSTTTTSTPLKTTSHVVENVKLRIETKKIVSTTTPSNIFSTFVTPTTRIPPKATNSIFLNISATRLSTAQPSAPLTPVVEYNRTSSQISFIHKGVGKIQELTPRQTTPKPEERHEESTVQKIWNFFGSIFQSSESSSDSFGSTTTIPTTIIPKATLFTTTVTHDVTSEMSKDLRSYTVKLRKAYNVVQKRHFAHSLHRFVDFQVKKGYIAQKSAGRVISMKMYHKRQAELEKACPYLMQLYNIMTLKTRTQLLSTNISLAGEYEKKKGWKRYFSSGYCVSKAGKCGASVQLESMYKDNSEEGDYVYITQPTEKLQLKAQGYQEQSTLCYIWPL